MEKITSVTHKVPYIYHNFDLQFFWQYKKSHQHSQYYYEKVFFRHYLDKMLDLIGSAEEFICIQTECLESKSIVQACLKAAENGIDIYFLSNKPSEDLKNWQETAYYV